jgi:hypothetical protein
VFLHDVDVEFPVGYIPVRWIKVTKGDKLGSVRNWFDKSLEPAINEGDAAYKVWHDNMNRVRGGRLCSETQI